MRKIMVAAGLLALTACSDGNKFTIEGTITNAKDSTLYLENVALDGLNTLDSVKLDADGKFRFSHAATGAPEFYLLRIADEIINISIDSTETVSVSAEYPAMASAYTVEGSEQCKIIRELAYKQQDLLARARRVEASLDLSYQRSADSIKRLVEEYKEDIKVNYIYKGIGPAASYFALFQRLGNMPIFNPNSDEADVKAFGAVATSWDFRYPESQRSQNLHNITVESMKNIRYLQNQKAKTMEALSMAEVTNIIDIRLPDNKGATRSIKELKGKVVLLDFHVFGMEKSAERIMMLRELYNKFHDRGLEIFQVALDADEHFWKTRTEALPWICVRDADGTESRTLREYNVREIPTFFLISRDNALYKRDAQMTDVEKEIQGLL